MTDLANHDDPGLFDGIAPARRFGGRPPGALNKRTRDLEAYMRAKGLRLPAFALLDIASMGPVALREWYEANAKKDFAGRPLEGEVPTLQQCVDQVLDAAFKAAPYVHSKMPIKVDLGDQQMPMVVLNLGGAPNEPDRRYTATVDSGKVTLDLEPKAP